MKKSLILAVLAASLIGCNSGNNNQNQSVNQDSAATTVAPKSETSTPSPSNADPNVDWDKPLYALDSETGDTIRKWIYTDSTIVIREEYTEEIDGYEGEESTFFDKNGRLTGYYSSINSGNVHTSDMDYTYNGKIRTGKGCNNTEGYPVFTQVKEVTYFADAECNQDTLGQTFSAEVEWDSMEDDAKLELESYYVSKFTNGKVTETTNYGKDDETGKMVFRSRIRYEYYSDGQLAKYVMLNEQGTPMGEYAETVYTYKDNTRESSNTGTGEITYYARKK